MAAEYDAVVFYKHMKTEYNTYVIYYKATTSVSILKDSISDNMILSSDDLIPSVFIFMTPFTCYMINNTVNKKKRIKSDKRKLKCCFTQLVSSKAFLCLFLNASNIKIPFLYSESASVISFFILATLDICLF